MINMSVCKMPFGIQCGVDKFIRALTATLAQTPVSMLDVSDLKLRKKYILL